MRGLWFFLTFVFTLGAYGAGSQADGKLVHNPFKRPASEAMANVAVGNGKKAAQPWKPELRAIIVAGKGSMVNVGGTIVLLGGEIEGYRLAEVREHQAVFVKGQERLAANMEMTSIGIRSGPPTAAAEPEPTSISGRAPPEEPHISQELLEGVQALVAPVADISPGVGSEANTTR
jgi:hypothetical protein